MCTGRSRKTALIESGGLRVPAGVAPFEERGDCIDGVLGANGVEHLEGMLRPGQLAVHHDLLRYRAQAAGKGPRFLHPHQRIMGTLLVTGGAGVLPRMGQR